MFRKYLIILSLVVTILSSFSMPFVKALYVAPVPTNTLFADDFENYTQGQNLGSGSTGANPTTGWGFYDSDTGGQRTINNTNYYSCCKSLWLESSSINSGKVDVHKIIPVSNTTTLITVSLFLAWNNAAKTDSANTITWSLEILDSTTKYECIGEYFPPAQLIQFVGGPGYSIVRRLAAVDDTTGVYFKDSWHHITMTCNIKTHTYVSAMVDNWDFTPNIAGMAMNTLADVEAGTGPGEIVRMETALVNGGTHTVPWWKWMDDLIVTDTTSGTPNIIQFGLVGYSAWIPLIMAMAGVNTTLSTWSLVIRLLKKNDGSALRGLLVAHTRMIVGMNIAVVAFLIVLVLGSIYLPGTCPAGAVCNG